MEPSGFGVVSYLGNLLRVSASRDPRACSEQPVEGSPGLGFSRGVAPFARAFYPGPDGATCRGTGASIERSTDDRRESDVRRADGRAHARAWGAAHLHAGYRLPSFPLFGAGGPDSPAGLRRAATAPHSVREVKQVLKQSMQMRKMIKQFGPGAAKSKLRGLGKSVGLS